MHLGPFGLNRLPNLHLELFLGQPRLRGMFTYPGPFDRT
jgi:hypothetical protein